MIRKLFLNLLLCFIVLPGLQAQVTFIIESLPANTPPQDNLYIAGDFTSWNPGAAQYVMHKNEQGKWSITLPAQPVGTIINYKFTRGSWATVEKGASGEEIANRTYTFGSSSQVSITIYNWADGGGSSTSTAAANVKIMSSNFSMPQLNRTRKIWIYLPPGYETSGLAYPVLYMHDGQNLFDNLTSFSGEWKVDEALNSLASQGKKVPIVIGIENGANYRIGEYTPWINPNYGGGDGEKYMQFIVETLKPYVDQNYRTLTDRENTGIMGSSLGGLISHFGALKYQSVFGKAGIFSPSYWFSDSVWMFTHDAGKQYGVRFYQLCGSDESNEIDVPASMYRMNDSLVKLGFTQENISNKEVAGGQHNEKLWSEAFSDAYQWLFNDYITSLPEQVQDAQITCYPNPVTSELTFTSTRKINFDTLVIVDMNGKVMKSIKSPANNKVDVRDLR
ncbi:MAG: alpha/beta hydrolase-fold protein, partial [Bacteroidales bacterium]